MTLLPYLLVGLGIGLVGGMVGIGGGVLLIPALTHFFELRPRTAAGISLAVLAMPVTLPGAWKYYEQGHLTRADLLTVLCLAVAFACGTYLGAHLQEHLEVGYLRVLFGLLLLFVGMRMLLYASPKAVHAAAGLAAVVLGWIGFVFLRTALGRKHLPPPSLGQQIRRDAESSPQTDEYYI